MKGPGSAPAHSCAADVGLSWAGQCSTWESSLWGKIETALFGSIWIAGSRSGLHIAEGNIRKQSVISLKGNDCTQAAPLVWQKGLSPLWVTNKQTKKKLVRAGFGMPRSSNQPGNWW